MGEIDLLTLILILVPGVAIIELLQYIYLLTILQGPRYDFTGLVIIIKRNQYYVSKAFRNNIRIDFNLILFANL